MRRRVDEETKIAVGKLFRLYVIRRKFLLKQCYQDKLDGRVGIERRRIQPIEDLKQKRYWVLDLAANDRTRWKPEVVDQVKEPTVKHNTL